MGPLLGCRGHKFKVRCSEPMAQIACNTNYEVGDFSNEAKALSAAIIGPDDRRRNEIANLLRATPCRISRQLTHYPEAADGVVVLGPNLDLVIVDLDSNPPHALELVERLCASTSATVMVYSGDPDQEWMIRSIRAGVREFLTLPATQTEMAQAISRVATLRSAVCAKNTEEGKLFVFWGAKGGSGVTTVATNFAISIARETSQRVLLIDFDLPLGDAALNLGLTSQYSTVDALENYDHLDGNFLPKLLVKHESGLFVLSAPGKITPVSFSTEAANRLIQVARQHFDYVVIDSGSRFELASTAVLHPSAQSYLVTQLSVPELRNSNRVVAELFAGNSVRFQLVVNRYDAPILDVGEGEIAKIMAQKPQWKIPNDFRVVSAMQNSSRPLAMKESRISRAIREMARAACELPEEPDKKRWLRF